MNFEDDLRVEEELRRACKAEDPGEAFTRRVLERVRAERAGPAAFADARAPRLVVPVSQERPHTRAMPAAGATWRMALAFAASLAITIGGTVWMRHARDLEEGQRARAQVLMALRLTSEKLNVVRSAVIEAQEMR
jgi:hypothetical protein